jgi:hypothetical protein
VLLPVGGGVGSGLPFGFEGCWPVVAGALDPDGGVPWFEAFGLVVPGLELFGVVFPGVDLFGVFEPGEVVAGGVRAWSRTIRRRTWRRRTTRSGLGMGLGLCPVVPEPPAGEDPSEGELWAMTQHPQVKTTKSSSGSFLIDI